MSAQSANSRHSDSLLRMKDVRRRTGLSATTVYRRVAAKTFPPKVPIGEGCVGWYESEIDAFVANPAGYKA